MVNRALRPPILIVGTYSRTPYFVVGGNAGLICTPHPADHQTSGYSPHPELVDRTLASADAENTSYVTEP